jgi:6-phosphogluconolactonase
MSRTSGSVIAFGDASALTRGVAEWFTAQATAAQGPFRVSLSGGGTPRPVYELLASDEFRARVPWADIHWYWGDERFVPHDHPDSNFRMVREAMLDRAPIPQGNIHPMLFEGEPEAAALRYERDLQSAYGGPRLDAARPLFDITLLGLGPDGHTASLLPGDAALEERDRWVLAVRHGRPEARITMTLPLLESSRRVAFVVSGREKADIFKTVRRGDSHLPAARLKPRGELIWFVDHAVVEGA